MGAKTAEHMIALYMADLARFDQRGYWLERPPALPKVA
jgi:hypothetical protein